MYMRVQIIESFKYMISVSLCSCFAVFLILSLSEILSLNFIMRSNRFQIINMYYYNAELKRNGILYECWWHEAVECDLTQSHKMGCKLKYHIFPYCKSVHIFALVFFENGDGTIWRRTIVYTIRSAVVAFDNCTQQFQYRPINLSKKKYSHAEHHNILLRDTWMMNQP